MTQRVIYRAPNLQLAFLVRDHLIEHGIEAHVTNEFGHDAHGGMLPASSLQVMIDEEHAEAAQGLVESVQQLLSQGAFSSELMRLVREVGQTSPLWPNCPDCRRARHTRCPVCETAGSDFPQAFVPDEVQAAGTSEQQLLVLCPTCDEPFVPEFLARCEWCGHPFADGYSPPQESHRLTVEDATASVRIALVVLVLAAVAAGMFGWFYYVLR